MAASPTVDDRFGVIVSGASEDGVPAEWRADDILRMLGLRSWYSFSPGTESSVPGAQQIELARPPADPGNLAERAKRHPGAYWILGNEPNVPAQDDIDPSTFATWYHDATFAIRDSDPTARFVGPNGLNWDFTCTACAGYTSTHDWSDGFVDAYSAAYGEVPLVDVWGMHVYDVDWTSPPLVNTGIGAEQIENARGWLDSHPGLAGKPIWVTEFGVIFSFDSYRIGQVNGRSVITPTGERRQAAMDGYVREMVGWLTSRGTELGVQKWFFFSALPIREPYQTQPAGIALLQGPSEALSLTSEARVYLRMAGAANN
jgi:hypothetical protein